MQNVWRVSCLIISHTWFWVWPRAFKLPNYGNTLGATLMRKYAARPFEYFNLLTYSQNLMHVVCAYISMCLGYCLIIVIKRYLERCVQPLCTIITITLLLLMKSQAANCFSVVNCLISQRHKFHVTTHTHLLKNPLHAGCWACWLLATGKKWRA